MSSTVAAWTRSTSSAKRPTRSTSPLSTSSSGSTPPTSGSPSSDIVTPSRRRSRPARHVLASRASSWYGARWAASRPQRMPVAPIHSSILARSSSSRRNLRRTGSRPAKSSSCAVVRRDSASSRSSDTRGEQRVGLAQRPIGEADPEVGQATVSVIGGPDDVPLAERRLDERGEGLDVRTHHDDVARFERRIVGEEVEDRVAHHLDLSRPSVARVDLHAVVGGGEGQPFVDGAWEGRARRGDVGPHAGLDPAPGGSRRGHRRHRRSRGGRRRARRLPPGRVASPWRRGPTRRGSGCGPPSRSDRRAAGRPSRRRRPSMRRHSSGDGWSSRRWTSRPTASASSTSTTLGASRVNPNSDRRAGNATSSGSSRSLAHAGPSRSAGLGTPSRARRLRHSAACQATSGGSA